MVCNIYFLLKFLMNYSLDFLRKLPSVPFRPPRLVGGKTFHLNLLNFNRRSRFLQNKNSYKEPRSKLTKPLPYPTLSNSNNELNLSLLNTRSLNNKSLHIFNLLTSSIDFLGLTDTWHEGATSPSLLPASPSFHSFIELARSPTKPFSSSHSAYGGISLFYKSTFSAFNIHYPSYSLFECLFSSFKSPSNFTFVIALIYTSPTSSLPLFLEEFSVLTECLYMHSSLFFIF